MVNLDIMCHAVKDLTGYAPTDAKIWLSLRSSDFSHEIRTFLWQNMHDIQATGARWEKITSREHLAICPHCQTMESMDHILTKCDIPCQKLIWDLAETLWSKKLLELPWPATKYRTIMGCTLAEFKDGEGKPIPSASRLYHILVMESSWLIWKLRNE